MVALEGKLGEQNLLDSSSVDSTVDESLHKNEWQSNNQLVVEMYQSGPQWGTF